MADTKPRSQSSPTARRVFDAVYEDGVLKPLQDPGLPEHHQFSVQVRDLVAPKRIRQSTKALTKIPDGYDDLEPQGPNDLDTWSRDLDALAVAIPPEDFIRLDAALAEADKEAKALVRRQMGLA
jgi:predicted DNA-binding antitoxin AbrB/MazE fold protein